MDIDAMQELSSIMLEHSNDLHLPKYDATDILYFILAGFMGAIVGGLVRPEIKIRSTFLAILMIVMLFEGVVACTIFLRNSAKVPGYEGYVNVVQTSESKDDAEVIFTRQDERYKAVMPIDTAKELAKCPKIQIAFESRSHDTRMKLGQYEIHSKDDRCFITQKKDN